MKEFFCQWLRRREGHDFSRAVALSISPNATEERQSGSSGFALASIFCSDYPRLTPWAIEIPSLRGGDLHLGRTEPALSGVEGSVRPTRPVQLRGALLRRTVEDLP